MGRQVGPRVQQFIEDLTAALSMHNDEQVERRIRHLLALLYAAAESAEELDLLLSHSRERMHVGSRSP